VDLRLLEYFLAVAKTGNITKAAEQLHVTQPTISRQLMELEVGRWAAAALMIRGQAPGDFDRCRCFVSAAGPGNY